MNSPKQHNPKQQKQFKMVLKELYRYFYNHQYDKRFPTFRCADLMSEYDEFGNKCQPFTMSGGTCSSAHIARTRANSSFLQVGMRL